MELWVWKDMLALSGVLYLGLGLRGTFSFLLSHPRPPTIPKRLLSSKISIICILAGAYQYPEVAAQLPLGYYYGSNDYEPPVHFADEMDENPVYGSENCRQQTHTFTRIKMLVAPGTSGRKKAASWEIGDRSGYNRSEIDVDRSVKIVRTLRKRGRKLHIDGVKLQGGNIFKIWGTKALQNLVQEDWDMGMWDGFDLYEEGRRRV
ncbi:hypothetical protein CPB84DRAFT_1749365 [Gymnopilus junonius]|uniref:Uncharacterized protein n=1 Tax=Gymnopilus junonius TaxID=109634 RepID=A0A9P5TJQ4_GYMJU|nr:hypothetical protein CPB84DRAFT_1749365 [Gymnopilus junonius]